MIILGANLILLFDLMTTRTFGHWTYWRSQIVKDGERIASEWPINNIDACSRISMKH